MVVVEDQELAGADGYAAVVDSIPFFACEDRFYRETADMVGAVALWAVGVEDDVLFLKPAVVGLFIESGIVMVGQLCKIHGWEN